MSRLTEFAFERNGQRYSLSLAWDDEKFAEGEIAFGITATRSSILHPQEKRSISAAVSITLDGDERPILGLVIDGETVYSIPLRALADEESAVAQIIDRIPPILAGDPILGCLIRSGISASVGQIILCKSHTEGEAWVRPRLRAVGHCLTESMPDMCAKAVYRAAKCMVF